MACRTKRSRLVGIVLGAAWSAGSMWASVVACIRMRSKFVLVHARQVRLRFIPSVMILVNRPKLYVLLAYGHIWSKETKEGLTRPLNLADEQVGNGLAAGDADGVIERRYVQRRGQSVQEAEREHKRDPS
jgi:hypothetical protein